MPGITLVGDSITRGITANKWAFLLMLRLEGYFGDGQFSPWGGTQEKQRLDSPHYTLYNAGVAGNKSADVLNRFDTDVLGHPTDDVVLLIGVNDVANSVPVATIEGNIDAMVAKAQGAGKRIILATCLPYTGGTTQQQTDIQTLNTWIRGRGLPYIEFYNAMTDPANDLYDGTHPSDQGNRKMAAAIDVAALGWAIYPQQVGSIFGIGGLTGDWRMRADGLFRDRVTGQVSRAQDTAGASMVAPNARAWSQVRPNGRGYCADMNGTVTCYLPMPNMTPGEGTAVIIGGDPNPVADNYPWSWELDDSNRILLRRTSGTYGNASGIVRAAAVSYSTTTITKNAAGACMHAIRWKNGQKPMLDLDGTKVTGTTNCVTPAALPATSLLGCRSTATFPFNGPQAWALFFNRQLTDAEMATLVAKVVDGPPRALAPRLFAQEVL